MRLQALMAADERARRAAVPAFDRGALIQPSFIGQHEPDYRPRRRFGVHLLLALPRAGVGGDRHVPDSLAGLPDLGVVTGAIRQARRIVRLLRRNRGHRNGPTGCRGSRPGAADGSAADRLCARCRGIRITRTGSNNRPCRHSVRYVSWLRHGRLWKRILRDARRCLLRHAGKNGLGRLSAIAQLRILGRRWACLFHRSA